MNFYSLGLCYLVMWVNGVTELSQRRVCFRDLQSFKQGPRPSLQFQPYVEIEDESERGLVVVKRILAK